MPHPQSTHPIRRTVGVGVLGTMAVCSAIEGARAQAPPVAPPATATLGAYRPPAIALVQPTGSTTVPKDMPVVVFRYAQGEPDDPIDLRSLRVLVDGADRTALFQAEGDQAWGPLAPPRHGLDGGAHAVTARICSARGACGTLTATVMVEASAWSDGDEEGVPRRERVIDLLLAAARRLLKP